MALEYWDDAAGPWDRLQLGPQNLPGIWDVSGTGCARDLDEKKSPGKDGARIKDRGAKLGRFTLTGLVLTREDQEAMELALPSLMPKKAGGESAPLSIYHPSLAMLGITTVQVHRIAPPRVTREGLEFVIEVVQWTAAPKTTKSATTVVQQKSQFAINMEASGGDLRLPSQDALDFLSQESAVRGYTFS